MKIVFAHSFYRSSTPSGENQAVFLQMDALRNAGHEVALVAAHSDQIDGRLGPQVRAGLRQALSLGATPVADLRRFKPDLVHVHNTFPNWTETWPRKMGVPVVKTIHNFRPVCAAGTLSRSGQYCELCPVSGSHHSLKYGCYQNSRIRTIPLAVSTNRPLSIGRLDRFSGLVFLTEQTRKLYQRFGLSNPFSTVIPNFAELHEVAPQARRVPQAGKQQWIFAGRLSAEKGIDRLIKSWPAGRKLVVAGSGPLEAQCRKFSRGKDIRFLGHLEASQLEEEMARSFAVIIPSMSLEQVTFAYIEAIALGVPVLARGNTSVASEVERGQTGVIFKDFDNLDLAMTRLEQNRLLYASNAKARFEREFSRKVWLQRMGRFYESVMES